MFVGSSAGASPRPTIQGCYCQLGRQQSNHRQHAAGCHYKIDTRDHITHVNGTELLCSWATHKSTAAYPKQCWTKQLLSKFLWSSRGGCRAGTHSGSKASTPDIPVALRKYAGQMCHQTHSERGGTRDSCTLQAVSSETRVEACNNSLTVSNTTAAHTGRQKMKTEACFQACKFL